MWSARAIKTHIQQPLTRRIIYFRFPYNHHILYANKPPNAIPAHIIILLFRKNSNNSQHHCQVSLACISLSLKNPNWNLCVFDLRFLSLGYRKLLLSKQHVGEILTDVENWRSEWLYSSFSSLCCFFERSQNDNT